MDVPRYYFYVTFHSKKNVFRYNLDGSPAKPRKSNKVLESSEGLHGLRGMFVHNGHLYLANSYKHDSKILKYGPSDNKGKRSLVNVVTKHHPKDNSGLHHPYAIAMDNEKNIYASNQNTNTVTHYYGPSSNNEGALRPLPPDLEGMEVHPGTFVFRPLTQNTSSGPLDQGIRGLAFDSQRELLFIAHKYENSVLVYNKRGLQLNKDISVSNPIGIYFDSSKSILYIGSHNKQSPKVVAYDTLNWCKLPIEFVHTRLAHPAGIVGHGEYLYVVSMGDRSLLQFEANTGQLKKVLIEFDKNDDPEHVIIVQE